MQLWALFGWWYGSGWAGEWKRQTERLSRVNDYFSFGNLFRTLFQPFRQIDAGPRKGGLEVQFRAWLDRTMSRFIGAVARTVLIFVGGAWWIVSLLIAVFWMSIWPLLPLAPIIGLILTLLHVGVTA